MHIVVPGLVVAQTEGGDVGKGVTDFAHVAQGLQAAGVDVHLPFGAEGDEGDALVLCGLGEGVFEGRAAVAHGVAPHMLGPVDVAEGHVVERLEDLDIHIVQSADTQFLRPGRRGAGDELVGHQDVALLRVYLHVADGHAEGVGVGGNLLVGEGLAHMHGLDEGQQEEMHGAVAVVEHDGQGVAVVGRCEVDAGGREEARGKGETLGGVVVAADDEDRHRQRRQAAEEVVHQLHSLGGGHGLVVDIARDDHGVGAPAGGEADNLVEDKGLVLEHGELVHPFAKVQVGEVHQFHAFYNAARRELLSLEWCGRQKQCFRQVLLRMQG